MSAETPRTDALYAAIDGKHPGIQFGEMFAHARQLERELQAAQEALEVERMRLAGCSSAALGYFKAGDSIHLDYVCASLQDVTRLYAKYTSLRTLLTECLEYLSDQEDVSDGSDGPVPNLAMSLCQEIRRVV